MLYMEVRKANEPPIDDLQGPRRQSHAPAHAEQPVANSPSCSGGADYGLASAGNGNVVDGAGPRGSRRRSAGGGCCQPRQDGRAAPLHAGAWDGGVGRGVREDKGLLAVAERR